MDSSTLSPDVRELWDEFLAKQDEPQYMRNVLSGLAGIMLVGGGWCVAYVHRAGPAKHTHAIRSAGRFWCCFCGRLHRMFLQRGEFVEIAVIS